MVASFVVVIIRLPQGPILALTFLEVARKIGDVRRAGSKTKSSTRQPKIVMADSTPNVATGQKLDSAKTANAAAIAMLA